MAGAHPLLSFWISHIPNVSHIARASLLSFLGTQLSQVSPIHSAVSASVFNKESEIKGIMTVLPRNVVITFTVLITHALAKCNSSSVVLCCENFSNCNTYPEPVGILQAFDAPTPYLQECGVECVRKLLPLSSCLLVLAILTAQMILQKGQFADEFLCNRVC